MRRHDSQQHLAILKRRKSVADLWLAWKPIYAIAEEMGVDRRTIERDLAFIRKEWIKEMVYAMDKRKAQELARVDRLEEIAYAAWLKSCENAESETEGIEQGRANKDGVPLPDKKTWSKTTRGQSGDPRFLERIAWCIEERCKILGILKSTGEVNVFVRPIGDNERQSILDTAFAGLGISLTPSGN